MILSPSSPQRCASLLAANAPAKFDVREEPTGRFMSLTIESPSLPRRRHQTDVRPLTLIAAVNLHGAASEKPTSQEASP